MMKKTLFKFRCGLQRGISLLEVLLSLSVIAIILVMATRYYVSARENVGGNDTIERMALVKSAVQEFYSVSDSYADLTYSDIQARLGNLTITGDPTTATATLNTSWGSGIAITGSTNTATLDLDALTTSQCSYLQARLNAPNNGATAVCAASGDNQKLTLTLTE